MLNDDIEAKVVEALQGGNYLDTSAAHAGISVAALYKWMDRGRREIARLNNDSTAELNPDEERYVKFVEAVEKARSRAEVQSVALIRKAALDGTWQAAAWFLERSHPRKWGRWERVEHSGPDGGAIQVEAVSADALEDKVMKILQAEGRDSDTGDTGKDE